MNESIMPGPVETWPIDRLRPYARNAKIHGTDQVAKIAASMAKFGWTSPVLVATDGELIAGHGRVLAADSDLAPGIYARQGEAIKRLLSFTSRPATYTPRLRFFEVARETVRDSFMPMFKEVVKNFLLLV